MQIESEGLLHDTDVLVPNWRRSNFSASRSVIAFLRPPKVERPEQEDRCPQIGGRRSRASGYVLKNLQDRKRLLTNWQGK
jgi:hypothetical protein